MSSARLLLVASLLIGLFFLRMAKLILDKAGFQKVHNAGPWTRLQ